MKLLKRMLALALAAACLFSLTGCSLFSHSYEPSGTGIYIASDRTVTSAEITSFDNSSFDTPRYIAADFRTYATDTVKAFNTDKAGIALTSASETEEALPVSIEKLEFDEDTVTLILKFQNFQYYLDFYGTTEAVPVRSLVVGSVADGISSGLDLTGLVDADGKTASAEDVKANTEYTLVMLTGETEVQCEGKIVYYSGTMRYVDKYTVVSSGSGPEFIIFK